MTELTSLPSSERHLRRRLRKVGTRIPSHQLSGRLYVSGRPEQHKERVPTVAACAVPFTGGDVKKSGELGRMFDIPTSGEKPPSSSHNSRSARSASGSGPLPKLFVLQPTGLITSGPVSSSSGPRRSIQEDSAAGGAAVAEAKPESYGAAVTRFVDDVEFRIRVSRRGVPVMCVPILSQRLVADFYISDFQSGLRTPVKAGYGASYQASNSS